jgi:hypothetical protein
VKLGGALEIAVPPHPTKGHPAIAFAAGPTLAVHHRQSQSKNVNAM